MALRRLTHERYERMRADGTFPDLTALPTPPTPPRINDDLPVIPETRPTWWQVRRTEQHGSGPRFEVLIFECREEATAMKVCLAQKYDCRIVKWGDKRPPFQNFDKPIKVIAAEDPRRI